MVDNTGMDNGGARPNGYIGELDDIRNPVRCDSYFRVGGHRRVRQRIGKPRERRLSDEA